VVENIQEWSNFSCLLREAFCIMKYHLGNLNTQHGCYAEVTGSVVSQANNLLLAVL